MKKWLVFLIIVVILPVIVGTAFAADYIRLVVNGKEITPSIPLQIINGEMVGSIKDVPDALGYDVMWDKTKQMLIITDRNKQLLERRVQLLENAFALDTPDEIADNWAKGVMSRNGALQYALLCDGLRKKTLPGFEAFDWITGTSSPWIDKFEIINKEEQNDTSWKYTIIFHYTDSTGSSKYSTSSIVVEKKPIGQVSLPIYPPVVENKWCVTSIQ